MTEQRLIEARNQLLGVAREDFESNVAQAIRSTASSAPRGSR
jgi:hypothetical protein